MSKSSTKNPPSKKATTAVAKTPSAFTTPAQGGTDADSSLQDLFTSELKDTLWAEKHLVRSLPKMIAAAGSSELQSALENHLEETKAQVTRLEKALESLGEDVVAKKCDAMEGLTMSGEHVIENTLAGSETRDTGIIMSGLKVENFEITTYKGLIQVAGKLGKAEIADMLQQTLEEEIAASELLQQLSESGSDN